jgi:hypothetical protein
MKLRAVSGTMLTLLFVGVLTLAFKIQPAKAEPVGIGEWTSDGRIELCVHLFDTSPSLEFYPHEPEIIGYIFAWVDLSIKNVGSEDVYISGGYVYLKDANNYLYEHRYADTPLALRSLHLPPGETIRGELYFEVPSGATIKEFVWSDYASYINVAIPEFPSFLILPLFMIATLLAVIIYKRKHST